MNSLNEIMDLPSPKQQPQMESICFNHHNICNKLGNKIQDPQESHQQDPQKAQEAAEEVVATKVA